jgi:hypothetical protein
MRAQWATVIQSTPVPSSPMTVSSSTSPLA